MAKSIQFCATLKLLMVVNFIKLAVCTDKEFQNTNPVLQVSELYSELSVVSDNVCNNHEKNVAFDVILIDNKKTDETNQKQLSKRHASSHGDKKNEFKDRPRADQKSLLLVFDGTGSMHDDLQQLRLGAEEIINDFSTREDSPIFNYVLVIFRDPNVEAPFETRNPQELLEKLKYINVLGGGDCPEMALSGLRIALKLALQNSLAYVFSDASAKDHGFYNEVVELIQAKQVTVNFLLTGYCDNQKSLGYKIYQRLSRVSNGQVYDMNKNNVKDVLLAIRHTMNHNYAALKSVDVEKAGTSKTNLSIDKSITKLSVSITGENATLSIRNPLNKTVQSNESITLKNLKLVNINDPEPSGVWRIEAGADSSHSIRLSALSDLKFEFGFSLYEIGKKSETFFQPLAGYKNILSIFISKPPLIKELSNVTIILVPSNPNEISIKFTIPLKKQSDKHYSTLPFDVPRQMFKIQLNGIDAYGNLLERLISTGLVSTFGNAPEVNIEANQKEIYENENLYIKCSIISHIPVNVTINHNGKLLKHLFSNQSNELELNINSITINHSGNYECTATNAIANRNQEIEIKVLTAPKIKILKDWQEVKEDSNNSIMCVIEGINKKQFEVTWLDENDNILKNNSEVFNFLADSSYNDKIVKCRITSDDFIIEDAIKLNVNFAPRFINNHQNISSTVTFGSNITLDCTTIENPSKDIQWFFTPKHSKTSDKIALFNGEDYYELQVFEEGRFECFISNKIGSVRREFDISVIPKDAPKIVVSNNIQIANNSGNIELTCECYSCLKITNFTWTHEYQKNIRSYFIENIENDSFKTVLKIDNITENDGGKYECEIENYYGKDKVSIELLVQRAPKIEAILLNNGSKSEISKTVELIEGHNISLECMVDAFPEPSIYWIKENKQKIGNSVFLEFENVTFNDNSFYDCIAENSFGKTNKSIYLNITYPPRRKQNIVNDFEIIEDSEVVLDCDLVGNPEPKIIWIKNSRNLPDNKNYKLKHKNKILTFRANEILDGIYECKGINQLGESSIIFTVVTLFAPKFLESEDQVIEVKKGDQLKLSCDAIGYPVPSIQFVKDNIIFDQGSIVEIKNASSNFSGALHCIAENKIGRVEKIFYINVIQSPLITSHFENVTIKNNHSVNLICEAEGIPTPTIRWIHQNGKILSENSGLMVNSSFIQGTVLCEASNSFGKNTKHLDVIIIKEPVLLPIARQLQTFQIIRENDHLELICPFENYNNITWTFNNSNIDGVLYKVIDKKLIIHNINRSYDGEWKCSVSNTAGSASFAYNVSILASPVIFASWNLNDQVSDFLFTESDIDEKTFKVGEKLELNCTAYGSPTPKILWKKSTDLIGEGEILTIENLQFHHSDIYTCSAENNQGSVKKFFKVDVISAPFILPSSYIQTKFQKSIGDSVILKCNSVIANPVPIFLWFRNGEILDESENYLEIDKLDTSNDGVYRCLAKNTYGSVKIDFHISVYEPAEIIKVEEQVVQKSSVLMLILSCTCKGNPLPIISWILNGHIITTTSKLNIEKLFKSITDDSIYFDGYGNGIKYLDPLQIEFSKQKFYSRLSKIDSKNLKLDLIFKNRENLQSSKYNCYCFNALGRSEKNVEITIKKKPYAKENYMHDIQNQEILEHLPLLLSCLVDAEPEPKITWHKNGLQIYENETIKFLNNNKFLKIEESFFWHSGNYTCLSKNSEGELIQNFHVVILSPPKFSSHTITQSPDTIYFRDKSGILQNNNVIVDNGNEIENTETINVLRGADVILECWIESSPRAKIYWVKINTFDSSKNEYIKESKNFLTISSIQESSNYMCYANNTIGSVRKLFFINVQYAPEMIEKSNQNEEYMKIKLHHSVNFDCKVKASPEANISWTHNSTNIEKLDNNFYFTSNKQIMRIININKNHEGKYVCTAKNSHGSLQKAFYVKVEIPVQFSPWSEWSECSVSCGSNGIQYRSRACILLDAIPSYNCSGENMQMRKCNEIPCPIDGGWGKWSDWSPCPKCYYEKSFDPPKQKRIRKCDSPIPAFGGIECEGEEFEEKTCKIDFCPINGGWSAWSNWSACSKTCGQGFRSRKRFCNNPQPKHNGKSCYGDNFEIEECKIKACNNYNLRKSQNNNNYNEDDFNESTEHYKEIGEFKMRNDENIEPQPYQFMQHREIEYSPPLKSNVPRKIKITLDTYKPISKDIYQQHVNENTKNQIEFDDDYFEREFLGSSTHSYSHQIEQITEKNCAQGFKYNVIYRQCEEINECKELNPCKLNEKCINTIGSYRCDKNRN